MTAELGPLALVPPVSLANPVDAQTSHLGRQAKPLTDLTIGDLLQADLVGDLLVEGNSGKPVRSLIKPSTDSRSLRADSVSGMSWIRTTSFMNPLLTDSINESRQRAKARITALLHCH